VGEYPNTLTTIAARAAEMCLNLDFPVVVFFCPWASEYRASSRRDREKRCLLDLVCSIIRHMVDLLPVEFETERNIGPDTFTKFLQGNDILSNWGVAVELLTSLAALIRVPFFVFLDGLEHLEGTAVQAYFASLLGVIMSFATMGVGDGKFVKILLTTSGNSKTVTRTADRLPRGCLEFMDLDEGC